mgnify:CR=1 FL=1
MNLFLPGMYVAADSAIHRLDPRVKGAAALLLMILPFAAPEPASQLLLVAFVAAVAALSRVPLRALIGTLRTVFWLGLFMFVFYFFTTPGRAWIVWGPVALSWEGLLAGATQIYRLCLLVSISALLSFTTSPAQVAHALEVTLGPLGRLGLPVREAAMVVTIALRFVPTLNQELENLVRAQAARGADIRSPRPWRRVAAWVPVFVPLFVAAFRRAEELATAMEARGFRGMQARTHLYELRIARRDGVAALVVLGLVAAACALQRLS